MLDPSDFLQRREESLAGRLRAAKTDGRVPVVDFRAQAQPREGEEPELLELAAMPFQPPDSDHPDPHDAAAASSEPAARRSAIASHAARPKQHKHRHRHVAFATPEELAQVQDRGETGGGCVSNSKTANVGVWVACALVVLLLLGLLARSVAPPPPPPDYL